MNKNVLATDSKFVSSNIQKHFNPLITLKLGSDGNNLLEDAWVKQFKWYTWVFRMGYSWRELGVLSYTYS